MNSVLNELCQDRNLLVWESKHRHINDFGGCGRDTSEASRGPFWTESQGYPGHPDLIPASIHTIWAECPHYAWRIFSVWSTFFLDLVSQTPRRRGGRPLFWWAPRLLRSGGVLVEVFFFYSRTVVWQLYCALVLRGCNCSAVLLLGSSHTTSLTLRLTRSPDHKNGNWHFPSDSKQTGGPP